jgi:integrase
MATVRKVETAKGSVFWQARWRERGRARAKNFAAKREATAYAARMGELIERRGVGDAERLSTGGYLARFIAELELDGSYSPASISSYRKMVRVLDRVLGRTPLARLTTAAIGDGYAALLTGAKPLSRLTVNHAHRVLVSALNRAVRRGLLAANPASHAAPAGRKGGARRRVRVFTPDEVTALLAAASRADPETLAIASLLLATGLRRAELLGLTLEDLDLEHGLVHVRGTVVEVNGRPVVRDRGKSAAARRTLALPPTVVALLRAQKTRVQEDMLGSGSRAGGFLFPGPGGQPMPPPWLTRRLKRLMRAAGISDPRAPCHAWRHTSGTLTFDATTNIKLVQARLGHANIATTMQLYVHPLAEREREAAAHFERLLGANKT